MNYDILVNKNNPIDKNFKVENLTIVGKHFDASNNKYTNENILLEKKTAIFLKMMLHDANKIDSNIVVIPDSGYRSIEYQEDVMNYYIEKEGKDNALKRVAIPGTSEHHTGLAIDIAIFDRNKYIDDVTGIEAPIKFMHENCFKYGFILRYPKGKEEITGQMFEPWHFRFVDKLLSNYLYVNNFTLEEYYEKNKGSLCKKMIIKR